MYVNQDSYQVDFINQRFVWSVPYLDKNVVPQHMNTQEVPDTKSSREDSASDHTKWQEVT